MRGRRARDYEDEYRPTMPVTDLPLFERPVPYQKGSDTSQEAAESLEGERVARLRAAVFEAYVKAGPSGLTADQAAAAIGETVLAVRPRCTELYQAGLLEVTDERRRNDSGLSARVLRRAGQP